MCNKTRCGLIKKNIFEKKKKQDYFLLIDDKKIKKSIKNFAQKQGNYKYFIEIIISWLLRLKSRDIPQVI